MAFTNGFTSKNFEVETASWLSYYLVTDNENHFELNWAFFITMLKQVYGEYFKRKPSYNQT